MRPLTALRTAVVLATLAAVGACTGGDEAPPGPTTTPPRTAAPVADDVPLEGLPGAEVRWRDGAQNDEPAVLAARRLLALRYAQAASEDPNGLTPLYGTIADGTALEVFGEPYPNPAPPPEGLAKGPVYAWVMSAGPAGEEQQEVDLCYDTGWSDDGTAPTTRQQQAFPLRITVADAGGTWKATTYYDPARDLVGPEKTAECRAWGETHTAPDSPA